MNAQRRLMLQGLTAALMGVGIPGLAKAASGGSPIYVVKYISFSCNFCRNAEQGDTLVEQAVSATGGAISVAPVDTSENPNFTKERLFYASRRLGPDVAKRIRLALYSATQDHGLTFNSLDALDTWLSVNAADWLDDASRKSLILDSTTEDTTASIGRALRLARSAGVDVLPSYVVLQDGNVKAVFDRQGYPSLHDLRDKLARRISEMVPIQATQLPKERL